MRKKHRIQLIEVFNGLNELTETKFVIQKKFLWWWVNLKLARMVTINFGYDFHGYSISNDEYHPTLPIAKSIVDKLIFMPKKYKHEKIYAGVYMSNFVYCIKKKSNCGRFGEEYTHVVFDTINDLKKYVDKETRNKKRNTIKEVKKQNVYYFFS